MLILHVNVEQMLQPLFYNMNLVKWQTDYNRKVTARLLPTGARYIFIVSTRYYAMIIYSSNTIAYDNTLT